jgi:hypothetical protein
MMWPGQPDRGLASVEIRGDYEDCAGRTFYRVGGNDPPILRDFYSYRDLGRPLLDESPEGYENWIGVSVYEKRRQAVALARYLIRRRRPAGTFIVEIVLPNDRPIWGKRMGGEGHYNLFAGPDVLLACYSRTMAVLASTMDGGER